MSHCILVIEDNIDMADLIAMHLRDMGAETQVAYDGSTGLRLALSGDLDLIILDLMLPGIDGLSICRKLRQQKIYTPVLMLTAKSSEFDRVLGLDIGADDYLTKPFSIRELLARVKAIFRRVNVLAHEPAKDENDTIHVDDLFIDHTRRRVILSERELKLTSKEFDLLWHFAQQPGRVFTREQLLDTIWGYGHDGYEHTVNSHINRLRAKIEQDPSKPRYILTVWGVGYKFTDHKQQTVSA